MKIYAELDCLFDTRLSAIASIDATLADKLLSHKDELYFKRLRDDFRDIFPDFPQSAYEKAYSERDVNTLLGSMPTEAMSEFSKFTFEFSQMSFGESSSDPIQLVVNTYPYAISEHLKPLLEENILMATGCDSITFENLLPEFINPSYLFSFSHVLIYDLNTWLLRNYEQLEHCPLPAREFISPVLFDEKPAKLSEVTSVINSSKQVLAGTISYRPQPISRFSIYIREDKTK